MKSFLIILLSSSILYARDIRPYLRVSSSSIPTESEIRQMAAQGHTVDPEIVRARIDAQKSIDGVDSIHVTTDPKILKETMAYLKWLPIILMSIVLVPTAFFMASIGYLVFKLNQDK